MATRSSIALMYANGMVESIYCHNYGHLDCNGFVLEAYYPGIKKIKEMLRLADMSILDTTIESSVFYNRDRGENGNKSKISKNIELWYDKYGQSFNYIYVEEKRKWYLAERVNGKLKLTTVRSKLKIYAPEKYEFILIQKEYKKVEREKIKLEKSLNKSQKEKQMKV